MLSAKLVGKPNSAKPVGRQNSGKPVGRYFSARLVGEHGPKIYLGAFILCGGIIMKVAVFIDGGHLRSCARKAGKNFDQNFITQVAQSCVNGGENLFRILYYDCEPYTGKVKLPVSGTMTQISHPNSLLKNLAKQELVG